MRVLVGNTVKTDFGEYRCATREEAEALYLTLEQRAGQRAGVAHDDEATQPWPPQDAETLDS